MISKQSTNTQPSIKRVLESTPRLCLYFLIIFTPLARGSVQGWAITTIHIITLIALTAFLLNKTLYGRWKWIKTPLDKPNLALLIVCSLSFIFSVHWRTSFWAMALLINYMIIFYLVIHTIHTYSQFKKLIYFITGVAVFLSLFGILKLYGYNPFPWWDYPELNKNVPRLSSTFGNANHLAGYMEMVILFLCGLLLSGFERVRRWVMICAIPLLFISLILSISRGGWISAIGGFVFLSLVILLSRKTKQKAMVLPLTIGLLTIVLIVLAYTPSIKRLGDIEQIGTTPNLVARVKVWGGIVEMIKDYPLLGTGPGTFSMVFTQYQPPTTPMRYFYGHNDYLHFISEIGIFLPIIMIWMLIVFYKDGLKKLKHPNLRDYGIALGGMAGVTAILIHSTVDFNLHIPSNAIVFTMLVAFTIPQYLNHPEG